MSGHFSISIVNISYVKLPQISIPKVNNLWFEFVLCVAPLLELPVIFQDLNKELEHNTVTYISVDELYNELLHVCEEVETATVADVEVVKCETEFVKESWYNVSEKLSDLRRCMINVKKEMASFDDLERRLDDLFDFLEDEISKQGVVSALPVRCEQFEKATKVEISLFYKAIS